MIMQAAIIGLTIVAIPTQHALAWGDDGHKTIALIAAAMPDAECSKEGHGNAGCGHGQSNPT